MKKRIAAILFAIILVFSFSACSSLIGQSQMKITFTDVEGGKMLKLFEGTSKEVDYTIPDEFNGVPIVELGAFSITESEILETLRIGKNIKKISSRAIVNNKILKNIIVDPENEHFASVDGVLFSKDMKTILTFPNKNKPAVRSVVIDSTTVQVSEYTIPDGVETISEMAFYKCQTLGTVVLPNSIISINEMAFFKCKYLDTYNIPDNVTTIKRDAFGFCGRLTDIFIPKSVTEIGKYAFCDCTGAQAVRIERASLDGVTVAKDWMPYKATSKNLLFNQTREGE